MILTGQDDSHYILPFFAAHEIIWFLNQWHFLKCTNPYVSIAKRRIKLRFIKSIESNPETLKQKGSHFPLCLPQSRAMAGLEKCGWPLSGHQISHDLQHSGSWTSTSQCLGQWAELRLRRYHWRGSRTKKFRDSRKWPGRNSSVSCWDKSSPALQEYSQAGVGAAKPSSGASPCNQPGDSALTLQCHDPLIDRWGLKWKFVASRLLPFPPFGST